MSPDENWLNVGVGVRRTRKLRGLTMGELAAASGLSHNAIGLVERGQVAPTVATLCRLAEALGVRAAALLEDFCPEAVPPAAPTMEAQQTIICLSGSMVCEMVTEAHSLKSGDNFCTPGPCSQRWRNTGDEPAVVIMILSRRPRR